MSGIGWAMHEHDRWLRKQIIRIAIVTGTLSLALFLFGIISGFWAILGFIFTYLIASIVVMFWSIW